MHGEKRNRRIGIVSQHGDKVRAPARRQGSCFSTAARIAWCSVSTSRRGKAQRAPSLRLRCWRAASCPQKPMSQREPHCPTSRLWKSRCRASHTSVAFAKKSRSARCSSRQRVRVNFCNSATLTPDTVKRRRSTMAMSASAARPFCASTRRSGGSAFQNQRQRRRSYAASRHSAAIKRNSASAWSARANRRETTELEVAGANPRSLSCPCSQLFYGMKPVQTAAEAANMDRHACGQSEQP